MPAAHTGIQFAMKPKSGLQKTSTNANNSLALGRTTGLPTGAWGVWYRTKFLSWTSGNATQNLMFGEAGWGGQFQIYADISTKEIRFYSPTGNSAFPIAASYSGWAMAGFRRVAAANLEGFLVVGGTVYSIATGNPDDIVKWHVLGLSPYPNNQPNQLYGCTGIQLNRYPTNAELISQAASDAPLPAFAGSIGGLYTMASAANAHVDTSGNGRNFTVVGAGTTVSDSPY